MNDRRRDRWVRPACLAVVALFLTLLAGPSVARTLYLVPEPSRPEAGDTVAVRLLAGAPFSGDAIAHDPSTGARLERVWTSGRQTFPESAPSMPAVTVDVDESGVQLFAYEPSELSVDPAGQRRDTYCKALVVVGAPAPGGKVWRSELGHRLEIVPATDPVALAGDGGEFAVQVLFDREPLAGSVVAAIPETAPGAGYRRGLTDVDGKVGFELDRPGPWMIHVVHKNSLAGRDPAWEILEASLVVVSGPDAD
jgi:hypothetical protein